MNTKLTPEQKEANKVQRAEARKESKRIAKIEAEKNQLQVKQIEFSIEWKKSRTWGNNPHLEAWISFVDGTSEKYNCTASGCGYCKESTVIAEVFNAFLKYKLYQIPENKAEALAYGIRIGEYKGYSGGIGVESYYRIAENINGEFKKLASGKTYDAYKLTLNN
jgi:hypothetical protein